MNQDGVKLSSYRGIPVYEGSLPEGISAVMLGEAGIKELMRKRVCCRSCGNTFYEDEIEEVVGACNLIV